jgi:hypothetical protein
MPRIEFHQRRRGRANTIRLLKNIAGLWLLQECRRIWNQAGTITRLERSGASRPARRAAGLADRPDDPALVAPKDMPAQIQAQCRASGQPVPEDPGAMVRCILESLAMRYRMVLGWLRELTGNVHRNDSHRGRRHPEPVAVPDGRRRLQLPGARGACRSHRDRKRDGPGDHGGDVGGIAEARELIRRSFEVVEYTPQSPAIWDDAYGRFEQLFAEGVSRFRASRFPYGSSLPENDSRPRCAGVHDDRVAPERSSLAARTMNRELQRKRLPTPLRTVQSNPTLLVMPVLAAHLPIPGNL